MIHKSFEFTVPAAAVRNNYGFLCMLWNNKLETV